ncbi:hypothetical protein [Cumulibacter manganitolerans]|uniref:hypothetical protein n=1 Tax=Cumulibacter manganitolerans TaxID=1884992 RepID=UPI0012979EB3|nr:hypothetical protein [Cumulibacter manganitolerans]
MNRSIGIDEMNRMCNAIMQLGYQPHEARIAATTMSRLVNKQGFVVGTPEYMAWARREIGNESIVSAAADALAA